METYIVKIYRRPEPGEEPAPASIVEDAGSGRAMRFADSGGLLALLRMKEKKRRAANKCRAEPVKCAGQETGECPGFP